MRAVRFSHLLTFRGNLEMLTSQYLEETSTAQFYKDLFTICARDTMNYRSQPRDENRIINEFTLLQLLFSRQV